MREPLTCQSKSSTWTKSLAMKLTLKSCDSPAVRRAALLLSQTLVITRESNEVSLSVALSVALCSYMSLLVLLLVCQSFYLPGQPSVRLSECPCLSEKRPAYVVLWILLFPLGFLSSLTSKTSVFNQLLQNQQHKYAYTRQTSNKPT